MNEDENENENEKESEHGCEMSCMARVKVLIALEKSLYYHLFLIA